MRKAQLLALGLLLVLLVACAPKAAPAPSVSVAAPTPITAPSPKPAAPPVKPAWELEWEATVQAAKAEGRVALAISAGNEPRRGLLEAVKDKYRIPVESIGGTAGTIMSKILAERRAGLYLWDVMISGGSAHITTWKPAGCSSPLEPTFILPDLTNAEVIKRVWYDGKLPWIDRDRHVMAGLLYLSAALGINTNLVKPEEIRVWDDLLNPKWSGKMLLMDPTLPGTAADGGVMMMLYEVKGEDWVRRLAAQEPIIVADDRLAVEWLAHGKYPLYLAARQETMAQFLKAGAAIAHVMTKDVTLLTTGSTAVSLIDKAPHPNSAKVLINYYLSKEGLTMMSKARLNQSARLDVPTDFLQPDQIRQPGGNYWFNQTEERLAKIADQRKKSGEIFGHLIKK